MKHTMMLFIDAIHKDKCNDVIENRDDADNDTPNSIIA